MTLATDSPAVRFPSSGTVHGNRTFWMTDDIENCFPNVPIQPLLEIVSRYLPADNLTRLITTAIGGDRDAGGCCRAAR